MKNLEFIRPNIVDDPIWGYQIKIAAVSAMGFQAGFTGTFDGLIDPGARNTIVSEKIGNEILRKIRDEKGNRLVPRGKVFSQGVYGKPVEEPVFIIPHFYIGGFRLKDAAIVFSHSNNFQCLIGRSILHQCEVTLDPEANSIKFLFKQALKSKKHLTDTLLPFEDVYNFAEISTSSSPEDESEEDDLFTMFYESSKEKVMTSFDSTVKDIVCF